jgi:hypothetical protein
MKNHHALVKQAHLITSNVLLESIHLQLSCFDLSIHSYCTSPCLRLPRQLIHTTESLLLTSLRVWQKIISNCKRSPSWVSVNPYPSRLGFSNIFYWNPSISLGWSLNIYSYQSLCKEVHSAFPDNSICKRYCWSVCIISTESTQGCLQFELGRLSARTAGSCDDIAKIICQILKNMCKH